MHSFKPCRTLKMRNYLLLFSEIYLLISLINQRQLASPDFSYHINSSLSLNVVIGMAYAD